MSVKVLGHWGHYIAKKINTVENKGSWSFLETFRHTLTQTPHQSFKTKEATWVSGECLEETQQVIGLVERNIWQGLKVLFI